MVVLVELLECVLLIGEALDKVAEKLSGRGIH